MITKEFLLSGNATFTITNDKGESHTFRVSRKQDKRDKDKFVYLVGYVTDGFEYMGILQPRGAFSITKTGKFQDDDLPVKIFRWIGGIVWGGKELPNGYDLSPEGNYE